MNFTLFNQKELEKSYFIVQKWKEGLQMAGKAASDRVGYHSIALGQLKSNSLVISTVFLI